MHRSVRASIFISLLLPVIACEVEVQSPADRALVKELDGATRLPLTHLVLGEALPAERPIDDLPTTRDRLATDARLAPLADALRAGGYDDETAAQMVFAAAAHNSGHELDATRARHAKLSATYEAAITTFWTDLERAEQAAGIVFDRRTMLEAGVIGWFKQGDVQ